MQISGGVFWSLRKHRTTIPLLWISTTIYLKLLFSCLVSANSETVKIMHHGETAITSLPRGKFLTAVSCSCLAVNSFAIYAKKIQKRRSVYVTKICVVISVVPWKCPLGDNRKFDRRFSLLIQRQWPVCQRTGLTKNAGHTLYISIAMSCKRLLWSVGNEARLRSSSYVSVVVLKTARRARSWMRSIFRPSEDLQKFQTKWQYVKCGITAVLYSKSLAWHGIRLRKRMRTPTFWLALVHVPLMCCVKLRFSSIFTPSSLICSVFNSWSRYWRWWERCSSYLHQCFLG